MVITWAEFRGEVMKASKIAVPMVGVSMAQYMMQAVSIILVGHIDQLSLSSVAIATSLTNVTGFSLLSGLVGGLETLCGQAHGGGQYRKVGVYTYSAIISLLLVCLPVSVVWIFLDKLLILIGQDLSISLKARKYAIWLIPALLVGAIVKPLVRCLQSQSITLPLLVSSFIVLCFHVPVCWALIFKLKLGSVGAGIAFSLSNCLYLILIVSYVAFSPSCENARVPLSKDAFLGMKDFFRFAVPSAVMVCLKWWSLEVLVLISGLLPNPKLETSLLSISFTISTLHFTIAYGIGATASTRVSNELGAANAHAARVAVCAALFLAVTEGIVVSVTLFCCRKFLGRAYTNDKEIVNYVAAMTPFLSLSIITDSLQTVISGIAKGSGWQHIGAYVNLGAFYLCGIPASILLGFTLHLKSKGLWIGIVIGLVVQSTILSLITIFTNWQKQAIKARERISKVTSCVASEQIE